MSLYFPEYDTSHLELLGKMIEAERSVSRSERDYFYVSHTMGGTGSQLIHPGWPEDDRVFMGDIEVLADVGLIKLSHDSRGNEKFFVSPKGYSVYTTFKQHSGSPPERIESTVQKFLETDQFKVRHPAAYDKWQQAEQLLWQGDETKNMTVIGHLIREALQEFTGSLLEHFKPEKIEPDKAKTVSRLKSVLESQRQRLGKTDSQFLGALIAYWGVVSDLSQRQEHGAAKEAEQLIWPDARRTVFQAALVMFEVDSLLFVKR